MSIHLNGFPFDSQITGYGSDGLPEYDRASNSLELSTLIRSFWRNGIFGTGALTVMAGGGMTVTVSTGSVLVQGRVAHVTTQKTLAFDSASSNPRFDRVVVRCDLSNAVRDLVLDVVKGTPAISPVAPALTRNESIWELCLATVRIVEGATSINQSMITDTRTDANLCGIVAATMTEVDTDRFYAQVQSDLESFRENEQSTMSAFFADKRFEFDLWFESIKDLLDESAASKLTAQLLEKASANSEIVSLSPSAWTESGEKFTQQVPCSIASAGVNDVYIVSPVPTSIEEYSNCGIFASEFISGYVFFTAKNKPDNTLLANVVEIEKGISGGFSMNSVATPIFEEKLGEMVSVSDAAERPAVKVLSHIEPVQAGSGDPSPDNVRAISGWNRASVTNDTSGQALTAILPETVYCGYVDWGTGELTVTHKTTSIGALNVAHTVTGYQNYTLSGFPNALLVGDDVVTAVSDRFRGLTKNTISSTTDNYLWGSTASPTQIRLKCAKYDMAASEFKAAFADAQIVYRLAEPYTIHLTPHQLNLLKGVNNVWSNTGDTALTYVADTKLYIDQKLAAIAAAALNN